MVVPDGEGGLVEFGFGIIEQGGEALAFQVRLSRQAAELDQGGVDIQIFGNAIADLAVGFGARVHDHERHVGALLPKGAGLGPFALLTHLHAVVHAEDDDGIVAQAFLFQGGQQASYIPVYVTDARPVGAQGLLGLFRAATAIDEHVGVDLPDGAGGESARNHRPGAEVLGQGDVHILVEVEEALRAEEGGVRLGIAAGNEERLALLLGGVPDEADGFVRVLLFADIARLVRTPAVGIPAMADEVFISRPHLADAVDLDLLGAATAGLDPLAVLLRGDIGRLEVAHARVAPPLPSAEVPGLGVLDAGVEDLAGHVGRVAVLLEVHREAVPLRMIGLPPGRIVVDAGGNGPVAGQQRGTGRTGEWILAVVVLEEHALRGQAVQIGCMHLGRAVDLPVGAHIIRHDEQDVHFRLGLGLLGHLGLRALDGRRSGEQSEGDGNERFHWNGYCFLKDSDYFR